MPKEMLERLLKSDLTRKNLLAADLKPLPKPEAKTQKQPAIQPRPQLQPAAPENKAPTPQKTAAQAAKPDNAEIGRRNAAIRERIRADLEKDEGYKNNPYTDSRRYITVGIGKNIHERNLFKTLKWLDKDRKPASEELIRREYENLKGYAENRTNENLILPDEEIDRLFREHIDNDLSELRRNFPEFDNLPPSAQEALLDMQYNLGGEKFSPTKWPKLYDAVKRRNWEEAAEQVHRVGPSEARNAKTRNKMLKAAEEYLLSQR